MSYQVLARKYRPRTFAEMVGQEHVLRALINSLEQNRLHHAYLFTGTRGVGKTTLARLLAKCLNCETGITANPCEKCTTCCEINEGRFIDLLEVDAASRTKVEDTRELLDNVQYAPNRGRFKIYLIDEVHMLSGHSFNALLKTLEEPPAHVKFLLATTDPQRLPVTVLSRCLQFHLKNLLPEQIKKHLEDVLSKEKIEFEPNALNALAQAANGSLRDALSLLDQAIAHGAGKIATTEVHAMLGTIEQTHVMDLLTAIMEEKAKTAITVIDKLAEQAADFYNVLEELLSVLHRVALAQIIPDAITTEDKNQLNNFAKNITKEDVQLYYQIALIGKRDLPLAPSARSGFEMIVLRMLAFKPANLSTEIKHQSAIDNTNNKTNPIITSQSTNAKPFVEKTLAATATETEWQQVVKQLNLTGFTLLLANNCTLEKIDGSQIHLVLDANHAAMRNAKQETRLAEALSAHFGHPVSLHLTLGSGELATPSRIERQHQAAELQTATENLEKDPNIQNILQTFNAKIQPASIQTKSTNL